MSTFNATNSYSLATHDIMFSGYTMKIYQGKSLVASHDLSSSSIAVKAQSGNFCTGTITWSDYHFTKEASQEGPCAAIQFWEGSTKMVGVGNENSGETITKQEYDISQCPIEMWVDNDVLHMKCPCDGSTSCTGASCYEEVDGGTCVS